MKLEPFVPYSIEGNYPLLEKVKKLAGSGDLNTINLEFIEKLSFALTEINTIYRFPKLYSEIDTDTCGRIIGLWNYLLAALEMPANGKSQDVLTELITRLVEEPADYEFPKHVENDTTETSFTPAELIFAVLTWGEARKSIVPAEN